MKQEIIQNLEQCFHAEKQWYQDGYYRLRTLDEHTKELAYLLSDPCGGSIVHPQITLEKQGDEFIPTKLIDLQTTPVQNMIRDLENAAYLDQALQTLVAKFEEACQQ